MLYEQLMTLNALPITNTDLGDVQSQISNDFENIKYKLGYPCKQKYESQLQRYIILIPTCGYLIYSILTTLNKQPITDENTYLFVQIILIIFYFIFFGCIWRVFKYLLYSKKIKGGRGVFAGSLNGGGGDGGWARAGGPGGGWPRTAVVRPAPGEWTISNAAVACDG